VTAAIAAIVPTRNRAELAMRAVRSLLDQDCEIDIYLSDNSASPDALRDYCAKRRRVTWLRPPRELSMPEHWEWAIGEAMARSPATHFTLHYDRKASKPRHWGELQRLASRNPDLLITFANDQISHHPPPLRLWQAPWTGKMFRLATATVAALIAQSRIMEVLHAVPALSNCLIPRTVLETISGRFGSVCSSTGPDSAFLWRFLALHERYLHYDRAPGVVYASHRSNGLGYLRGTGGDFADYRKTFGERPWLDLAPLPGVNLGQNMLYHEHERVRRETGDRLPPLDRAAAIADLGRHLAMIEDPEGKAELRRLLAAEGWAGREADPPPAPTPEAKEWEREQRFRMRWFGKAPPTITGFSFRDDKEALRYAMRFPRAPQPSAGHLDVLGAVEIAQ
jgi:hypothetical protein